MDSFHIPSAWGNLSDPESATPLLRAQDETDILSDYFFDQYLDPSVFLDCTPQVEPDNDLEQPDLVSQWVRRNAASASRSSPPTCVPSSIFPPLDPLLPLPPLGPPPVSGFPSPAPRIAGQSAQLPAATASYPPLPVMSPLPPSLLVDAITYTSINDEGSAANVPEDDHRLHRVIRELNEQLLQVKFEVARLDEM